MRRAILGHRLVFYALLIAVGVSLAVAGYLILNQSIGQSPNVAASHPPLSVGEANESKDAFVTNLVQTTLKDLQGTTLQSLDTSVPKEKKNGRLKIKYNEVTLEYPRGAQRIGSPFRDAIGFTGGHRGRPHKGIDIGEERGVPIIAAADGKAYATFDAGSNPGNRVLIIHAAPSRYGQILPHTQVIRAFEIETRYLHLDEILIPTTVTQVKRGQVIGTVGNTGKYGSEIPHLHFEVKVWPREGGIDELEGSVNPHYFWAAGIGKITCYDPDTEYPSDITVLTWPLKCE